MRYDILARRKINGRSGDPGGGLLSVPTPCKQPSATDTLLSDRPYRIYSATFFFLGSLFNHFAFCYLSSARPEYSLQKHTCIIHHQSVCGHCTLAIIGRQSPYFPPPLFPIITRIIIFKKILIRL